MHEHSSKPVGTPSHDQAPEGHFLAVGLRAVAEEATSFRMRQRLLDIARQVGDGVTLEAALRAHRRLPRSIGDVHALVRLGVPLEVYVVEAAVAERRKRSILRAIRRTAAYPVFLLSWVLVFYLLFDRFIAGPLLDMAAEFDNLGLERAPVMAWNTARGLHSVAAGVLVAVPLGLLALGWVLWPSKWRRAVLAMPGIGSVSVYLELFPALRRLSLLVD